MKQTKFTQAMIDTVAEINKVRPASGEEAYRAFNGINYRYNLWLCVGDHYGCIPQEAHDYFHNIWSKQFCDDHLLVADDIKAAVLEKAAGDQGLKVLQKEVLQRVLDLHPDKHFHKLSLSQHIGQQLKAAAREQKAEEKKKEAQKNNALEVTADELVRFLRDVSRE
ncbi:Conserved_hypothetical protein [Hexamita inflata]|uniref:Uncharacterized protein n=1 Tax=Hexamita inflata TaxID=28002 RepID=A0ABP1GFE5_9EUKA